MTTYTPRQSVIVKTPLRVTLGGGGTDLPFYAREKGGFLISAAIDEYASVSMASRPLDKRILVQTTSTQFADHIEQVNHRPIRETLKYFRRTNTIQVATFSTLPTGVGLGSSSTQIVGMAKALATLNGQKLTPMELARTAHHIERNVLGLAGGVQDQYIAALGGIQIMTVDKSGRVEAQPLEIEEDICHQLERKLVLVYSGEKRNSHEIIKSQEVEPTDKIRIYDAIKEIGRQSVEVLRKGDVETLGYLMEEHWSLKKQLSKSMSNTCFDSQYAELKSLGSTGGKLVGAGGGGFFMMAVPKDVESYVKRVYELGYSALDWSFDFEGSHIINQVACPTGAMKKWIQASTSNIS